MLGNSFGSAFRITTWGESHGPSIGVVIDGCPPGVRVEKERIQRQLDRRRPGQSRLTTQRKEPDRVQILSGVFEGKSLGTPITLMLGNKDARSQDYESMKRVYRPSHADMTYDFKYGLRNWMGGGRSSARETAARVAAGAIAEEWLSEQFGISIIAWVRQVQTIEMPDIDIETISRDQVEKSPIRCPDSSTSIEMADLIDRVRKDRDSVGGVIEVVARGCPAGWGEPVFDKLDAMLAHAFLSIPATKGVEIGSGFRGTTQTGSQHNDPFIVDDGEIRTSTNRSGGIQGGISNGMPITARVAFKPTATVNKEQATVTSSGEATTLAAKGRHDPCVLARAVPIVEAMTAIVLMDMALRDRGQMGNRIDSSQPRF